MSDYSHIKPEYHEIPYESGSSNCSSSNCSNNASTTSTNNNNKNTNQNEHSDSYYQAIIFDMQRQIDMCYQLYHEMQMLYYQNQSHHCTQIIIQLPTTNQQGSCIIHPSDSHSITIQYCNNINPQQQQQQQPQQEKQ